MINDQITKISPVFIKIAHHCYQVVNQKSGKSPPLHNLAQDGCWPSLGMNIVVEFSLYPDTSHLTSKPVLNPLQKLSTPKQWWLLGNRAACTQCQPPFYANSKDYLWHVPRLHVKTLRRDQQRLSYGQSVERSFLNNKITSYHLKTVTIALSIMLISNVYSRVWMFYFFWGRISDVIALSLNVIHKMR